MMVVLVDTEFWYYKAGERALVERRNRRNATSESPAPSRRITGTSSERRLHENVPFRLDRLWLN